jgi:hypothetical protein
MESGKEINRGPVVIPKYFNEDYSWNNFINSINDAYDVNDPKNKIEGSKEVVGKVNFWHKLTVTLDNINEQNFPGIGNKVDKLTDLHSMLKGISSKCAGYFGAVSFTNKEPTTGKHSDTVEVIYCQFIGSVVWSVYTDEGKKDFTLNPGDIIYVPKSMEHEVVSLNPRAAISFMFQV